MFRRRKAENDFQDNASPRPSRDAGDGMWYKKPGGSNNLGGSAGSVDSYDDLPPRREQHIQHHYQQQPQHHQYHTGRHSAPQYREPPWNPATHDESLKRVQQHTYANPAPPPPPMQSFTPSPRARPRHHQQTHQQTHRKPHTANPVQLPPTMAGTPNKSVGKSAGLISTLYRSDWGLACKKMEDEPKCTRQKEPVMLENQPTVATPLHVAVCVGAPTIVVEKLLSVNPSATNAMDDSFGRVPLHWACITSAPPALLHLLVESNPKAPKVLDKSHGRLPLHYMVVSAASVDQVAIVLNAERRAATHKDHRGKSPVDLVMESNSPLKMEILDELNTASMAAANKKDGKKEKQKLYQRRDVFGSTGNDRNIEHSRGEVPAVPLRKSGSGTNLAKTNKMEIDMKLSRPRPHGVQQAQLHRTAVPRPASPSMTASSAPEVIVPEIDIGHNPSNQVRSRTPTNTRRSAPDRFVEDIDVNAWLDERRPSPSKQAGHSKPPSSGGFFVDPSLIETRQQKSPTGIPFDSPKPLSDDEIEYEVPPPQTNPARREQTWSSSSSPQGQYPENPQLTVQDALRQHAYDFDASGGGKEKRTINDGLKEWGYPGHAQKQFPRGQTSQDYIIGTSFGDGPGSSGKSPGTNQHVQHQIPRTTQGDADPHNVKLTAYQSPVSNAVYQAPTSNPTNQKLSLKHPPSASNLKPPPNTSNLKPPPNTSNLKPPPQTAAYASNQKSPPAVTMPFNQQQNLRPPPVVQSGPSNLKAPPSYDELSGNHSTSSSTGRDSSHGIANFQTDRSVDYSNSTGCDVKETTRQGAPDMMGQLLLDDMNSDIKSVEGKLSRRQKVLEDKNSQLSKVTLQLNELSAKQENLGRELAAARSSREQQQGALAERRSRLSQLESQIAQLQEQLERERSELEHMEASTRANEKGGSLEQQLEATRDESRSLSVIKQALEDEIHSLGREVTNCESELKSLQAILQTAARGDSL